MPQHPQKLECVISTKKNILLHTPYTTTRIRKLTLLYHQHLVHRIHSNLINYSNNYSNHKKLVQNHTTISCQVSLISFNLQYFLNILLIFMTLIFLKIRDQFIECASTWVCIMFLCDWSQVVNLWQKYHRNEGVHIAWWQVRVCLYNDDVHFDHLS